MFINKRGSRGAARAAKSLRWRVQNFEVISNIQSKFPIKMFINKRGSRGAARAAKSLRWSV